MPNFSSLKNLIFVAAAVLIPDVVIGAPALKPKIQEPQNAQIVPLTNAEKLREISQLGLKKNPLSLGVTQKFSISSPGSQEYFGFALDHPIYVTIAQNYALMKSRNDSGVAVSKLEINVVSKKNTIPVIACSVKGALEYFVTISGVGESKVIPSNGRIIFTLPMRNWDANEVINIEGANNGGIWYFYGCEMTSANF